MSNVVNFSELKRKDIRKVIKTSDIDHSIEVYNPNKEQKQEILSLMTANIDKDKLQINVEPIDILIKLIPMLSNIQLDLNPDVDEDRKIIDDILSDPSEVLLQVNEEIGDIVKEISNHTIKEIKNLSELPKEQLDKVLQQIETINEETPEEKELRELEEKMAELKAKVGK